VPTPLYGIYIFFFILLPLALSMIALLVAHYTRKACLPIPKTPWELMLLAKESPLVPDRSGKNGASDSLTLQILYSSLHHNIM